MSMNSRKAAIPLAAAIALLLAARPAQADFSLGLQEDDGARIEVTAPDDGAATYEGGVGNHFQVFLGFDNRRFLGGDILVQQGMLDITNTDRHEHVLHLRAARHNFTIPEGTDLSLLDSYTLEIGSVSVSFQRYGFTSNALSDEGFTGLDFAFPVSGLSRSIGVEHSMSVVTADGAPFLMAGFAQLRVGEITPPTQSGGDPQVPDATPAPAPAGLLLVLTGIPALVLGHCLRRRKVGPTQFT
jgi:hypothetical protein